MPTLEVEQPWTEFRNNRNPALRDRLILQYAPLVKYVVGRMAVSLPGLLSGEDILSYGTIGLIQAVDRFDPTVGVKFETYAIRRIRGSIIDAIRSLHPLSRDANRRARDIEHTYDLLTQRLGRSPSDEEVAAELGLSVGEFHTTLGDVTATIVSLDTPQGDAGDGERISLLDHLRDESLPEVGNDVEQRELYASLVEAIKRLSERDRLVISLYYYEELTLKEIAEVLSVSTSRVSQIHGATVMKLRSMLRAGRSIDDEEPAESRGESHRLTKPTGNVLVEDRGMLVAERRSTETRRLSGPRYPAHVATAAV